MKIKILLYEDNENLRESIAELFRWNDRYELVASISNPSQVLHDIEQWNPELILMDINMPILNGIEAVSIVRQKYNNLNILMLTVFDDDNNILNAICAGANGYLLKTNLTDVIGAIDELRAGGAPMTSAVARRVLHLMASDRYAGQKIENELLTNRERELLDLLVKGYSYKMLAQELNISIETIRTHIKKIYKKLQVNSATEAVYKYNTIHRK